MATRHDYALQARTYDQTRAASPSVLEPLHRALSAGPGRRLLDVGGGTGNYAAALRDRGFDPVLVDRSADMLAVAAGKGLPVARGDADALPVGDRSIDAVMLVSMLHHVPTWRRALDEARRVLAPGGRLALMAFAREHLAVHWVTAYFPATSARFRDAHQTLDELRGALPGADVQPLLYDDVVDGSMAALCRRPHLLLDEEVRRAELGDAVVLTWTAP
jgi:ubiquinone/menaquinone biosynthesis C-methylase UbiE